MAFTTQPEDRQHWQLLLDILFQITQPGAGTSTTDVTDIKFESTAKATLRISCSTVPTQ